jgi:FAD/FMN-containing dehydrogenase
MSRFRTIGAVEGDRIVVEAGAKWSEVLRVTLPRGVTPPVLTDYLELSVGGTLVVGGVGGTTSAFGLQSDHVIELEVVTGTGQKVTSCRLPASASPIDSTSPSTTTHIPADDALLAGLSDDPARRESATTPYTETSTGAPRSAAT